MNDSQQIMNGHAYGIDNLALSGSVIFDVDETMLVGGQSMEISCKVFEASVGYAGPSYSWPKVSNTSQENMMMFDKFRQLADEQTGIPSYSRHDRRTKHDSYSFRDVDAFRSRITQH